MTRTVAVLILGLASMMLNACGAQVTTGGAPPSPGAPLSTSAASPVLRPGATGAGATPMPTPGSGEAIALPFGCTEALPCKRGPGTYVLSGEFAFMQGLEVTIGVPWSSSEQDLGEFSVSLEGAPGGVLFWKDLTPVDHEGRPVSVVDPSASGFASSLLRNRDLVTSMPHDTTIGDGIPATTFLIGVAKTATNADPDCPVAVCVPTFKDTAHWRFSNAIGLQPTPLYVRLYVADILTGSVPHTLVLALDAGDAAGLKLLEPLAAPVIASIRLPPGTRPR